MMVISKYEELARFLEKQDPELLRMSWAPKSWSVGVSVVRRI